MRRRESRSDDLGRGVVAQRGSAVRRAATCNLTMAYGELHSSSAADPVDLTTWASPAAAAFCGGRVHAFVRNRFAHDGWAQVTMVASGRLRIAFTRSRIEIAANHFWPWSSPYNNKS